MLSVVDVFRAGADQSDLLTFALKDAYHVIAHGAIGPLDGLNLLIDTGAIPGMVDARIVKKSPNLVSSALGFFESHNDESIDGFLERQRPPPIDAVEHDRIVAALPPHGGIRPDGHDLAKMSKAERAVDSRTASHPADTPASYPQSHAPQMSQ